MSHRRVICIDSNDTIYQNTESGQFVHSERLLGKPFKLGIVCILLRVSPVRGYDARGLGMGALGRGSRFLSSPEIVEVFYFAFDYSVVTVVVVFVFVEACSCQEVSRLETWFFL